MKTQLHKQGTLLQEAEAFYLWRTDGEELLLQAKYMSNLIIDKASSCHGNCKSIIFIHVEFNKAKFYLKNSALR